ncbi:hypothetical protein GYA54_00375 [Candidatus Kuenenbacteria bacterium]|nr:hypothetical protein [Candidatus Kuenenbacteria bacterium]
MNKYLKIILYILAMMFGVFIFIYGGYDDSPGAQLLGVIFFVLGMVGLIKIRKNKINK